MMNHPVELLLSAMIVASIAYCLACIPAARRFFSRAREAAPIPGRPSVTVLIPLCGADFGAYENYASFCRQEYPEYQIVFGVQDPNDSSTAVVRKLMADFPSADIDLSISAEVIGQNPKVNNLHHMLQKARFDALVIADSDVRVGPEFLSEIVPPLQDERIGMVTCFYRAGAAPTTASRIEAVGITAEFAPGVLMAHWMEGMTFALGATMAMTRGKLESIGGFRAVADHLADDFMLGHLLWKAGHQILLLPHVVETVLPPMTLQNMLRHQVRWARGIRACRPGGHLGSIVTHGTALALLNVLLAQGSAPSLVLLALALGAQLAMARFIGVGKLGDSILERNLHLLPLRDLLSLCFWIAALAGREVEWRGKRYRLVEDGKMVPVDRHAACPE